ncbi:MAG: glycosyltransferase family 8 protein [Bryobacteraceae bacterium]
MSGLVRVLTFGDERYAIPLAAHGRSLLDNLPEPHRLHLTVIDGGITPATKDRLLRSWASVRVEVRFVPPCLPHPKKLPRWGRVPLLTYSRIMVADYYGADVERALVLDSDTILCRSITELFSLPFGEHILLAAQDPAIPFVDWFDGLASWRELGFAPRSPYFNAGVMLIHLPRWREADVATRAFEFIAARSSELRYFDQDALNATVAPRSWGLLDPRWQVQPRLASQRRIPQPHLDQGQRALLTLDPWLYHFSGRVKPWEVNDGTTACRRFFQCLDETEWSGWRPRRSIRAAAVAFYDRRLRGHCYRMERVACAAQRFLSKLRGRNS